MLEKFSKYEQSQYVNQEGKFVFEITNAELTQSKNGSDMIKFDVESDAGKASLYIFLNQNARWNYNKFIKACVYPNRAPEMLDYYTYHTQLIGKKFVGTVEMETYETTDGDIKEIYKITNYSHC